MRLLRRKERWLGMTIKLSHHRARHFVDWVTNLEDNDTAFEEVLSCTSHSRAVASLFLNHCFVA